MKLYEKLDQELIIVNCKQNTMEAILKELVHGLKLNNKIADEDYVLRKLLEREKLGPTSIGNFSAVPHTKLKDIREPIVSIGISRQGIKYHENDDQPVHFIILILSPNNSPVVHLQILAAAAALVKKSKNLVKESIAADNVPELYNIIKKYETLDE